MIDPILILPYELWDYSKAPGVNFITYGEKTKVILYHDGTWITEAYFNSNFQTPIYWLDGSFQQAKSIIDLISIISAKYPDVADWFLFNIKKFT